MKKVLSFVLVLSMILGSFGMAFAANNTSVFTDIDGKNCEDAIKVLTELKVVSGYKDGSYKPEGIVTRAEMGTLIVKALGLNDYALGTSKYSDMAGHWAEGYVAYATSLGILSGFADGTFRPNQTVTYDQAITMIVQALGYSAECLTGTYPAAFVTKAKSLGITDNVQTGAAGANRGDVAIMLYNALDDYIGKVNKDGDWVASGTAANGVVEAKNADTMLKRLGATQRENYFVDGSEDALINILPYVGVVGTAYFTDDEELLGIANIDSTFIDGDINITKKELDGDDDVTYTIKEFGLKDSQFAYIKNGKATLTTGEALKKDPKDAEKTDITAGGITVSGKVSGKSIKELYAVIDWVAQEAAQVDKGDLNTIKEDQELLNLNFTTLKSGAIDNNSFELFGVKSLEDIAADNIVAVYTDGADRKKDIVRIEVGTKTVEGVVSKVNRSESKFTIDGTSYKLSKLGGATDKLPDVGDEVKAYLDYDGKAYAIDDVVTTSDNYALVVKPMGSSGSYESDKLIKLFTKAGDSKVFTVKDSAGVIGDAGKLTAGQIITYKTNKAGEITEVKVVDDGKLAAGSKLSSKYVIAKKYMDENATIFSYDKIDGGVVKEPALVKVNALIDQDLTGEATYGTNKNGDIAVVVLAAGETFTSESFGVISDYDYTMNADGDKVMEITAIVDGKAGTWKTGTDYSAIEDMLKLGKGFDALYCFSFDGDEIDSIKEAEAATSSGAIKENKVLGYDGEFETVKSADSNKIELVDKGYEVVADAIALYPVFDGGDFDSWKVGKIESIYKDYKVLLLQTDKDSDNWDTVIYVKKADIEDFENNFWGK